MRIMAFLWATLILLGCSNEQKQATMGQTFSLRDFYNKNEHIDHKTELIFDRITDHERVAQLIITSAGKNGKATKTVERLIRKKMIGGVLMLGGDKESLTQLIARFDGLAHEAGLLPLIFSADAEPSLFNRKIKGTPKVPKTIELTTEQASDSIAGLIAEELRSMGIRQNFAPVVDISPSNEAITNRSFGDDNARVIKLASTFITATQSEGVAATAKHFPGHGLVKGDTHKQLVYIEGVMKEMQNYPPLIMQGVISIMVGHIAVRDDGSYDTHGLPASCSRTIVTGLLKDSLGFKGITVTDAMNMGAVQKIENASLKAVEAGCDMILMEPDEAKLYDLIMKKYRSDKQFREQINASAKKIIRLKICLNLL